MKSSDALDAEIKSQSADPAPEATSPEPAAPPQDPNLITFGLRRYDFLQMQEEIADHALEAYRPFLPGLWIGSAPGGQARIRSATGGDGQRGLMLGTVPGNAPWMTLEIGLDTEGLAQTGAALITFEGGANPSANVNMLLRIPCPDVPNGFIDTRPQSFILNEHMQKRSLAFFPPIEHMLSHDGFPNPVLIAFLPLRSTDFFLISLTAGPAR